MRVAYGIELDEHNDKYFEIVERIGMVGETIAAPGRFPVEALPILNYLPSWFPGGGFKKFGAEGRALIHSSLNTLYRTAVDGLVRENHPSTNDVN